MFNLSALELSAAIKDKKFSVTETVSAYIDLIEKTDSQYNAFLPASKEKAFSGALARAKEIQSKLDSGETLSPLAGVPVAVKDNISTAGIETTCASKMLSGYTPVYNATVIEKLEQAGMIVVGKTNMDEFAMGSSGETGAFGAVRNPWDVSRVAGGSSGGSAAAAAAGEIPLSLGSDTGGGIRQPCAFCGLSGIKPTYGTVSRYGLVAYASSLEQIGPIAKNIKDCAALLSVISGPDEYDSTCVIDKPHIFEQFLNDKLDGIKIGLPRNYFDKDIDEDVKLVVMAAAKEFETAGAEIEEFEMPLTEHALRSYYIIACSEASSNLAKFDGLKYGYRSEKAKTLSEVYRMTRSEGFGLEVKRRIMAGSFMLSSGHYDDYFRKAMQIRYLVKDVYDNLFKRFDMILSPVAPSTAYKSGTLVNDPMKMYLGDVFNVSVNLAGLPAAALPCGFDKQGLPIGFQLIGSAFSENKLINVSQIYQSRTDYHTRGPGAAK